MQRSHLTLLVSAALLTTACAGHGDTSAGGQIELTYLAGFGTPDVAATRPPVAAPAPGPIDPSGQTPATAPVVVPVPVSPSTGPTTEPTSGPAAGPADPGNAGDDGLNPFGGDAPEDRLMPSVVCMGLQEAQDEIQDHGVFFSRSEDATGEGRRQIWDRNWLVVAQTPGPGEPIGEREATLYVVKYDDDHPTPC